MTEFKQHGDVVMGTHSKKYHYAKLRPSIKYLTVELWHDKSWGPREATWCIYWQLANSRELSASTQHRQWRNSFQWNDKTLLEFFLIVDGDRCPRSSRSVWSLRLSSICFTSYQFQRRPFHYWNFFFTVAHLQILGADKFLFRMKWHWVTNSRLCKTPTEHLENCASKVHGFSLQLLD